MIYSKVSAPSVQPFLSSMGILVGEETHIVDKEVNEVAILRRVRSLLGFVLRFGCKCSRWDECCLAGS